MGLQGKGGGGRGEGGGEKNNLSDRKKGEITLTVNLFTIDSKFPLVRNHYATLPAVPKMSLRLDKGK